MDIRIFALVAFITVLGSFTEARSAFGYPYGNGGLHVDRPSASFAAMSRLKREIDDSNGESTTKETTTTSSTEPTTTPSSTTPSSTTPSSTTSSSTTSSSTTPSSTTPPTSPTTPSTTPTTTTEATSPTTTPTSTSASTPTSTTPTTPSTTPSTTTPESTTPEPKKPKDIQSRSNVDEPEPEDSTKKPGPSKDDKAPTPGPYFGAPGFGFGGPGFDPYFGYPGFNSIPGYGPNYAWTGTNNGPGYASAGASAGFGYPGIGYPTGSGYPFPTAGSPTGLPTGLPTGSPSFGNRGGFQDNSPNQNGYPNQNNSPNKANSPNQNGYFGGDPLYNAGPGFFYPGQFPNFNDPTFDMIKQIQAQIEAQQRANMDLHNRLANEIPSYGNYGGGVPQVASASIGLSPYGGFQSGQISPAAPGIESRFADELPPPSGNSYGVFASSSSSSMTGSDGQPINHKSSITGVNDNGRISYRTVHD